MHIPSSIPDLRVMRQFLAVAEHRSVRRAAEALQMSQPPLSVAMRQLEQSIGAQLFTRSALGVELTPAGVVLKVEGDRLMRQSLRAYALARATGRGELGEVRIGFITSAMVNVLPAALSQFSASAPAIRLKLIEGVSIEVLSMVGEGRVDLGLLSPPLPYPPTMDRHEVASDRLMAIVPRGHALADRTAIMLRELRNERFVSFSAERVPSFHHRITGACLEAGFEPQIAQEAAHVYTIISLVAGRLGVALVPSAVARLARNDVVPLPLRDRSKLLETRLDVAYLGKTMPAAARSFVELLTHLG